MYLLIREAAILTKLLLGWETIDAIVRKGLDAIEAELCEFDENLARADLTPAEQAAHHATTLDEI